MPDSERRRALGGIMFFPRGGSAHVARALARELPAHGWDVTLVAGSRSDPAHPGDAARFYAGLDVRPVDFGRPGVPMHPSYEDRPDAPDRVFAAVGDAAYEEHVAVWARALAAAGAAGADVLHLHHLTPLNEAAARVAPGVPVAGHLHGTELLMLERIAAGAPAGWDHAAAWAERMGRWARACARLLVLSAQQSPRAERLLGIDPARCVVVPNGFDPSCFRPLEVDRDAVWRAVLGRPLPPGPVIVYVGRFTAVKRLPLLVEAFSRVEEPGSLVVVGGHPGEWEGEHPRDAIERTGARNVLLAGWHEHEELPTLLNAADAIVLPSVREQFGQVLVEGMACGLPAIAVDRHGPADIVEDGVSGWLVEPDDEAGLRAALAHALSDPQERARRGAAALRAARDRYAWPALAGEVAAALDGIGPASR